MTHLKIRLAHLYADVMNIYGDRGNAIALRYRCDSRGIEFEVGAIEVGTNSTPPSTTSS